MIMQQLVSGKPGVSAIENGFDQMPVFFSKRAPRISTSSLFRSPLP